MNKTKTNGKAKAKPAELPVLGNVTIPYRDADGKINFSLASADAEDGEGNKVTVWVWVNGDWKVDYKDKSYLIKLDDVVTALVEHLNK